MKTIIAVAACVLAFTFAVPTQAQQPTLYKRLGGYDAMVAVSDDFLGRLSVDPQFARFFSGHSTDSMKRLRQHVVEFLCSATGGPCVYLGRDMKTSRAEWDASVKGLVATLDKLNVPAKEKDEVLGAVSSLKKDIVDKP
jgi:hemoglobin